MPNKCLASSHIVKERGRVGWWGWWGEFLPSTKKRSANESYGLILKVSWDGLLNHPSQQQTGVNSPKWDPFKQLSTVVSLRPVLLWHIHCGHTAMTGSCLPSGLHHHWLLCYFWAGAEGFFFDGTYMWVAWPERKATPGWNSHTPRLGNTGGLEACWAVLPQPALLLPNTPTGQGMVQWNTDTHSASQMEDDSSLKKNKQKSLGKGWQSYKETWGWGVGEGRNCTITKQYRF